ncbi:Cilia- and flagella-associated protein 57 [Gonapodya sp. JEL0774]|nr:Cilia- and flagella-associated protein 57 [Gonapodya sp. JEL0774]
MSIAAVVHKAVFGLSTAPTSHLHFLPDDSSILYPAGSNIILHSQESKLQRFVALSGDGVSAMAASPNKRYLAVAERARGTSKPSISIYEVLTMRKRKVLVVGGPGAQDGPPVSGSATGPASGPSVQSGSGLGGSSGAAGSGSSAAGGAYGSSSAHGANAGSGTAGGPAPPSSSRLPGISPSTTFSSHPSPSDPPDSRDFVSLCFSPDSKYLIAQASAPDWTLYYWAWEKSKVLAAVRTVGVTGTGTGAAAGSTGTSGQSQSQSQFQSQAQSSTSHVSQPHSNPSQSLHSRDAGSNSNNPPPSSTSLSTSTSRHTPSVPPVHRVSFNPLDPSVVVVTGSAGLRMFRYQEGQLRALGVVRGEARTYSTHTWITQSAPPPPTAPGHPAPPSPAPRAYLLLSTDDPRLLIFDAADLDREFRGEIILPLHPTSAAPLPVHSLATTARGFVAGCGNGTVVVYERVNDEARGDGVATLAHQGTPAGKVPVFRRGREMKVGEAGGLSGVGGFGGMIGVGGSGHAGHGKAKDFARVVEVAVSAAEDMVVVTTEGNQMYVGGLGGGEGKLDDTHLTPFSHAFHSHPITGLDCCVRKPLLVTCSTDRSVRVWNYVEGTCEVAKTFAEEAFSVAVHPSGLYVLVGFSDKLRLMNVLVDDVRMVREFTIRGCRECRFSTGGQFFACVHGNAVQIYSTWTFDLLATLKGHSGKVRSLHWSADDSRLVSAGIDGAVYEWSLRDMATPGVPASASGVVGSTVPGGGSVAAALVAGGVAAVAAAAAAASGSGSRGPKRESESIVKSCSYTCAVGHPDGRSVFAVGSDRVLREVVESSIVREIECDVVYTQVALSHNGKMMFAGTATGCVRAIKFPMAAADTKSVEYAEHMAHAGPVSRMRISHDDQYLFTAGEDGCVYVYKISDKDGRGKREREPAYADEILVTKSDLEEKTQMMTELKSRVEELKMENEYQLRLKDLNFNEKIKELTDKYTQEIEALKITSAVLRSEKDKEEIRHNEDMHDEQQRRDKELVDMETEHNGKLMAEYEKHQELERRSAELQLQWEKQLKEAAEVREAKLRELTTHFELKLKDKEAEIRQLEDRMRLQTREFQEASRGTEEDADREVLEIKHKYERRLKDERDVGMRLKSENGIMKKKFSTLQGEIDQNKQEIAKMYAEEKKLHGVIKSLEKDIAGLKKEIQERDETIQDKEKRIYDLKKKNQELEKFKFVLDYKIKELKRQIEPREHDIDGMTEQIKNMDVELEQYFKSNSDLEMAISDMKLKLKAAEKETEAEHGRVLRLASTMKRFKVDLYECTQFVQEPKALKHQIKRLYHKYCQQTTDEALTGDGPVEVEVDVQQEYARQRDHLERTVAALRKKVAKDQATHRTDNVRVMEENVALIKEINQLRRDLKVIRGQERAAEVHLRQAGRQLVTKTELRLPPIDRSSSPQARPNTVAGTPIPSTT